MSGGQVTSTDKRIAFDKILTLISNISKYVQCGYMQIETTSNC